MSTPQDREAIESAKKLLDDAQIDGRAVLLCVGKELPGGGLSIHHIRANFDKYKLGVFMIADLLRMAVAGTGLEKAAVMADLKEAYDAFEEAEESQ